eukprot:6035872-Pleurochrysis_carterae.AAC.1
MHRTRAAACSTSVSCVMHCVQRRCTVSRELHAELAVGATHFSAPSYKQASSGLVTCPSIERLTMRHHTPAGTAPLRAAPSQSIALAGPLVRYTRDHQRRNQQDFGVCCLAAG